MKFRASALVASLTPPRHRPLLSVLSSSSLSLAFVPTTQSASTRRLHTDSLHQYRQRSSVSASNAFLGGKTTISALPAVASASQTKLFMSTNTGVSGDDMLADVKSTRNKNELVGLNIPLAMESLAQADAVCFDVDSTVITEEGIDVLAAYLGKGEQVAALTRQAMEGGLKFQDALAARLDLLQPSKADILACIAAHPFELSPGVETLIQALKASGKAVYLVSGGFRIMIEPIAMRLNIDPKLNVVANHILHDETTGLYTGFDTNEPTSMDMGKPKALQQIQDMHQYSKMVMIGDGATDAQAKPPAQTFIGFGGVVVREKVKAASDWFVTDFDDLTYIVNTYGGKSK